MCGDDDAPLPVRVRFMRARQHEVTEPRYRGVRARALGDLGVEVGPLVGRKNGEAFAYPPCHDRSFFEAGSELGRDGEPTLLVQRVGEFPCEIAFQGPFRTRRTVPHRPPLLTTRREVTPQKPAVNRCHRSISPRKSLRVLSRIVAGPVPATRVPPSAHPPRLAAHSRSLRRGPRGPPPR